MNYWLWQQGKGEEINKAECVQGSRWLMSSVAHPLWITPLERKSLALQKIAICLKNAEAIELIIP